MLDDQVVKYDRLFFKNLLIVILLSANEWYLRIRKSVHVFQVLLKHQ